MNDSATPEAAYAELVRRSREETVLGSCLSLLEWDEETYMPRGGDEHRAEQRALLAGMVHERAVDPRYDELLSAVEGSSLVSDPESPEAVNVRELRHGFDRERKLPRRLVEELARVTTLASRDWADARDASDYKRFSPWVERLFALKREEADAVGYTETRYDALVDDFEQGVTTKQLTQMFSELRLSLVPLVEALRVQPPPAPSHMMSREYPVDRQRAFFDHVAAAIGFDFTHGRLDVGPHPFCTAIGPGDVRITIRYATRNLAQGLLALLHEIGHAFYDHGLDASHYGTPMGSAVSLGVHESQSRLWENYIGRSEGFWKHFYPGLLTTFHESLYDISRDTFRKMLNYSCPGPIRVYADEVTYDLHIIIRFELEQALLSGDLRAPDVPDAWNAAYERYLGIVPKDDREGCLQDIHWADGLIGYFPTYTLGNIYAAQLFEAAERDLGPLNTLLAAGEFQKIRAWLGEHVHRHGSRFTGAGTIARATGKTPDASALVDSLTSRYGQPETTLIRKRPTRKLAP